jgi:hypothetical protein
MSPFSPRGTFDRQLQRLLDRVLVLGSMVEQANPLLWEAHKLTRVDDRVIHVCERSLKELDPGDDIQLYNRH